MTGLSRVIISFSIGGIFPIYCYDNLLAGTSQHNDVQNF